METQVNNTRPTLKRTLRLQRMHCKTIGGSTRDVGYETLPEVEKE